MNEKNRKKIILSVINDLVTDQRVHRTCSALQEQGYDVTLIGRMLPESEPLHRSYKTVRMCLLFRKKAFFYAEYNFRLLIKLLFIRADAFYANDSDTLMANCIAAKLRRKPVFFDSHELFIEMPELVARPRVKKVWLRIENRYIPRLMRHRYGSAACTVSQTIADEYKRRYGIEMAVVRNVPIAYNRKEITPLLPESARSAKPQKILLYQGAVNIGRGVEWVIDAMPYLEDYHFVVAGTGDVLDQLKAKVAVMKLESRVTFLGRVEPEQLRHYTVAADLGLALLKNLGLNYYSTLPNRIADYAQAGIPVLATDFPEVRKVVSQYHTGRLISVEESENPMLLAGIIKETCRYWESLTGSQRDEIFDSAAKNLCWQNDKKVLLKAVDAIFQ